MLVILTDVELAVRLMPAGHPAPGEPTGPVRRRRRPIHHDRYGDGA